MTLRESLDGMLLEARRGRKSIDPKESAGIAFTGVSTDTRTLEKGNLFFALDGPNFDGNQFIADAFGKGAAAAVCSRRWFDGEEGTAPSNWILIPSEDTLLSLQELSLYHRKRFGLPLVAVTGTNGKTTTKEMIAACLGFKGRVLKTEGNFNNHIGVPLTLLRLGSEHSTAVLELGMSRRGEIRRLAQLARPSVGVITNVGASHLAGAGSVDDIIKGKSELGEHVEEGGALVLNADFPQLIRENEKWNLRKITFSVENPSDFRLKGLARKGSGFDVEAGDGTRFYLPLPGKGNVSNSLAALAVSKLMGVPANAFSDAMASMEAMRGRMEIAEAGGVTIINDSYNANPASVSLALETAKEWDAPGRKMALLGDMLELGEASTAFHREAGARAVFLDELLTIGEFSSFVRDGAIAGGISPGKARTVGTKGEAVNLLVSLLKPGDLVLIKGSRGMKLDEVFDALRDKLSGAHAKVKE